VEEYPRYDRGMTLEEEVVQLRSELAEARTLIAKLQEEVERLRSERANPPPFVKPNTSKSKDQTNSEKKPRRKRAKDQNGVRRREQTPTQMVQHQIEMCPDCGYGLSQAQLASRRQVIELPPPQPVEVTEHQLYKSWCARCSKWHYPPLDLSTQVIGQSRMGIRIASLIAYLRTTLRMPVRLIREYLHIMHNLLISTGEIVDLLHRVAEAERVSKAAEQLQEQVRNSKVVHGDETGWREAGQNGYIWCFCTPEGERWYEYDKSRAGAVAKRILGSSFKGVLITDFYAAYNDFPGEHQRCWVHLLRDLHELKEEHKGNEQVLEWAKAVRKMYDTAQACLRCDRCDRCDHCEHGPPSQTEREVLYIELMEDVRELGGKYASAKPHKQHPCHALCKRLLRHQDELFRFVLQPGVSADNNLAERSVRPLVVMRKVSGGSQSPRGSATRMKLASLFGTWRAKGLNPFTECFLLLSLPQPQPHTPQL
jgi:transposase